MNARAATAAAEIRKTWTDLRSNKITAGEARERMSTIRATTSVIDYESAKWAAAVADSRR